MLHESLSGQFSSNTQCTATQTALTHSFSTLSHILFEILSCCSGRCQSIVQLNECMSESSQLQQHQQQQQQQQRQPTPTAATVTQLSVYGARAAHAYWRENFLVHSIPTHRHTYIHTLRTYTLTAHTHIHRLHSCSRHVVPLPLMLLLLLPACSTSSATYAATAAGAATAAACLTATACLDRSIYLTTPTLSIVVQCCHPAPLLATQLSSAQLSSVH